MYRQQLIYLIEAAEVDSADENIADAAVVMISVGAFLTVILAIAFILYKNKQFEKARQMKSKSHQSIEQNPNKLESDGSSFDDMSILESEIWFKYVNGMDNLTCQQEFQDHNYT